MESFFSRFKNPLVLIAILLVQAIALATQVRRVQDPLRPDGQHVRLVRMWADWMVSPFERAFAWSGHEMRYGWSDYVNLRHVRQQNEDLQKQLAQLRLERAAISEDAVAAQRLRTLLGFKQQYIAATVAAQVIGTSGSDQSRLLTLDKGSEDGLKPGMPVITPDGAVGKLRDVFPHTAQLLLLSDPTSGAGVMLQSTRIRAVLHGSATGKLEITNLTQDSRIKPGENVLTTGGDQVFPRGLAVGTIESIKNDPEHAPYTIVTLKPAANLNQLEEVLVVTTTGSALDPKTEQELDQDAQTRAADVTAQRLPSLRDGKAEEDPNAKTDDMPPPDNSTQLVPKPKAAVHPDRYSPGSAPPAAELTPGAPKPAEPPPPPKDAAPDPKQPQ
jgi:rod shape-determining protein MreC